VRAAKYYCAKCKRHHSVNSKIGISHKKYATIINPAPNNLLQQAIAKRQQFHGSPPMRTVRHPIKSREIPPVLVVIGKLHATEYIPDTPTGSSNKQRVVFRHEAGDFGGVMKAGEPPLLCTDPEGENLYIIKPPGCLMRVEDWIYG